jgi:XTP/dITP diphosphohydrolase
MAIATPGGEVHLCQGECAGLITFSPRGEGGFGYDPVFFLPEQNQTMAELPATVKNQISHRGRAGQAARAVLANLQSLNGYTG